MVNPENELITTHICKTKDVGVNGNMFGGVLLALLDEAGASYAAQVCDNPNVVTIKMDEVAFERPIHVGQLIKLYGSVLKIGKTSVQISIKGMRHNVYTGKQVKVCETTITFVRIDENNEPVPIEKYVKEKYNEYLNKEESKN